jgi:CTP:molybdopterin cytidylyltransferase MocA
VSGAVAFIAAGGFATRMGRGKPKSLIRLGHRSLLEMTVQTLVDAGLDDILIANNRSEFNDEFREICSRYAEVSLVVDRGYSNTFLLMLGYSNLLADRFIFCYGHAPRSSQTVQRIWESDGDVSAGRYASSSRRDAIATPDGFLEPPFLITKPALERKDFASWSGLFARRGSDVRAIGLAGDEPEFNSPEELGRYHSYLRRIMDHANAVA